MITFDPTTSNRWKSENIHTISVEFISSGCEGTSLRIHENIALENYDKSNDGSTLVSVYAKNEYHGILQNAYITYTGSKWIMKSDKILTRCGCGKSFGLTTGNTSLDKIKLLKSKIAKSKKQHH